MSATRVMTPVVESWMGRLLRLAPVLLPFVVCFVGGFGLTLGQSLGLGLPVASELGGALAYATLANGWFLRALGLTLWVAAASAGLATAGGTWLAWRIWGLSHRWQPVAIVYKVPLVLPHAAVAFLVLLLCSQSGILASLGHALGLVATPADFPAILYAGNGLGVILAYVYKEAPFAALMVLAMLARLDPRLVQAATMLGAGPRRVFWRVVWPHVRPAVATTAVILFLYGFGAFDIPFLLAESDPAMLPVEIYNLFFHRDLAQRPVVMAMLVALFVFACLFIWLYVRWVARASLRERKL